MSKIHQGGFLISKIHQIAGRVFARMLKQYRITEINPAQGRIIFVLWQQDDIPIQELARRTSLGKSTLTRMLDKLEASGQLLRIYPEEDRRKVLIRLTDENKKMKQAYEDVSLEMNRLFYAGFSEEEIDHFEQLLTRILHNLEIHETR